MKAMTNDDLPEGWIATLVSAVCLSIADGDHQAPPQVDSGVPFITISAIADGKLRIDKATRQVSEEYYEQLKDERRARPGDILFSVTGSIGKVAYVDHEDRFVFQRHIAVLRPDKTKTFGHYLQYALQIPSVQKQAYSVATGTAQLTIPLRGLRELILPIAPLAEQKRIADKLEAVLGRVDACRTRLDRVSDLLKRFRQSVLAAATSGKLTEDWRDARSVNPWESVTVGDLCLNSFYGPRFGKDEYTTSDKGIPTVRTTDMTKDGRILITPETPRVLVAKDKLEHFRAQKDDLLITRTGSIGVMAVFDQEIPVMPSAYLIRFRFSERVLSRYIFFCLMSPNGQESLGLSTTAVAQPNINAEAIKSIEITLPPLPEQTEIVRRVEALFAWANQIEARLTEARTHVERLTPATLAKAFRGELVPQDPNDEPAWALLERVRVDRAISAKTPRVKPVKSPMTPKPSTPLIDLINQHFGEKWFTFDRLQAEAGSHTYDELKDSLFALLRQPDGLKPVLTSRFNDELETMEFSRLKK